ncbi:MAG: response regulator [Magnetococcales bacterium]|nr:response regulator [Magnetococcales bacterium]
MPISVESIRSAAILIVDDNVHNLEIARQILECRGFTRITTESNPLAVFDVHLAGGGQPFDLILLDLMMPHLDGFGVMTRLKECGNASPVLVLTAQNDTQLCHHAFAAGASDFLSKPFTGEEMYARVNNLLIAHLAQRRLYHENYTLEEAVRQRTTELEAAQFEIVRRLGMAGERRDNETGLHVVRMAYFSRIIALGDRMENTDVDLLFHAAPMHDIGKIGIPDRILLKAGRLDDAERHVMNTHVEIGFQILNGSDIPLLQRAATIARTHHEKWDGSGYPYGLRGDEIPLDGRIVAIADVFDALTSKRPYKKAWSVEDAITFICGQAGEHFDPRLVAVFEEVLPEILEVKEQFKDHSHD